MGAAAAYRDVVLTCPPCRPSLLDQLERRRRIRIRRCCGLRAPFLEREQEQWTVRGSTARIHALKPMPSCPALPFSKREAVARQAQIGQVPLDARDGADSATNPRVLGHALGPLLALAPTVDGIGHIEDQYPSVAQNARQRDKTSSGRRHDPRTQDATTASNDRSTKGSCRQSAGRVFHWISVPPKTGAHSRSSGRLHRKPLPRSGSPGGAWPDGRCHSRSRALQPVAIRTP